MKKIVILLIVILAAIVAVSCQTAKTTQQDSTIVQEDSNLQEVQGILSDLVPKGVDIYQVFSDPPDSYPSDGKIQLYGVEFRLANLEKYSSVQDIEKAIYDVYTKRAADFYFIDVYLENPHSIPSFADVDGRLYVNFEVMLHYIPVVWDISNAKIVYYNEKSITVEMPMWYDYQISAEANNTRLDEIYNRTPKTRHITIIKEDGQWKLDSALIGYKVK